MKDDSKNPNTNCLENRRCPECGSYGPFEVWAWQLVRVHDDGTDECKMGGPDWEEVSLTTCCECDKDGEWQDFEDYRSQKVS